MTSRFPSHRPRPLQPGDDRFVALAAELGARFAPDAARHDRDNTFVSENFAALRESGYTKLGVPEALGGLGASMRQICYAQAELAKHCASTALAVNMHLYNTLATLYRFTHGAPQVEGVLRRIAQEGLILMTSGGSDWIWPTATATRVDGGFRVTGRKTFCSQAPVATVLLTSAVHDDPADGRAILAMAVPMKSDGVEIIETWDAMGMRATGSHDVQLTDVFVPDAAVAARRPYGRIDPALRNALIHISPTTAAVYYGIAAGARDEAVRQVQGRKLGDGSPMAEESSVQRLVGDMECKLRTSWWALMASLEELGDDYKLDEEAVNIVFMSKRLVVENAAQVVDAALEAVGGASYYRHMRLEQAYRDVRAGKYHPLSPEKTVFHAGRIALGLSVDVM
jgi:acyl-CoA dehydrogenase